MRLAIVFFLVLLGSAAGLASPLFLKAIIDVAIPEKRVDVLLIVMGVAIGLELVRFGIGVVQQLRYTGLTARILFDARLEMLRHLHVLAPRFFTRARLGDLLSRINGDIAEMQSVASGTILSLSQNVLMLVVASAIQLWLSWRLFLLSLVVVPPALLITRWLAPKVEVAARSLRERNAEVADHLVETLSAHKPIVADGLEKPTERRFVRRSKVFIAAVIKLQLISQMAGGLPGIVVALGGSVVLLIGGILVIRDELALGSLIAFAAYQGRVYGPLSGFVGLPARLARARASVDRVLDVLDLEPEVTAPAEPKALPEAAPERAIELRGVSFRWHLDGPSGPPPRGLAGGPARRPGPPMERPPALTEVSFDVPAGARVGLVGPSGSGKSTLLDLLLRLHDPTEGTIRVDGIDLRELDPVRWRRRCALVLQEPLLFADTIAANIGCGRRGASAEDIEEAARAACAHEFVAELPERYETVLGERGARLSLGQRQRLAVARAILRSPRLLLLDEATAHLDSISDRDLRESLERLMEGRSTVVTTHRVAAVRDCASVVVLDRGAVAGVGSHDELLETCALYRELVERDGSG